MEDNGPARAVPDNTHGTIFLNDYSRIDQSQYRIVVSLANHNIGLWLVDFIGICGERGAGKSTMFKLMLRLYDPDDGTVLIGGRDIKDYNPISVSYTHLTLPTKA